MSKDLSRLLDEILETSDAPAFAAVVATSKEIVDAAAVGTKRLGENEPVSVNDLFHAGSNGKAMTAMLCGRLVADGRLSWDSNPGSVLHFDNSNVLSAYRGITLRMLLTHMAGVPSYIDDEAEDYATPNVLDVPHGDKIQAFSEWLLSTQPPAAAPGMEFLYSNAGYAIAAAMAEVVTSSTWETLMQRYVAEPLGVRLICGRGWPAKVDPSAPLGHNMVDGNLVAHSPNDPYQLDVNEPFLAPAGDACLSLPDYGRFLQSHLRGLRSKETILPSATIRELHNDGLPGVGMGWQVKRLKGLESLGLLSVHGGSARTFEMFAAICHERDLAIGFATNAYVNAVDGFKTVIKAYGC